MSQDELDAFLADLSELTRKHGIRIHGCGCCGSPWACKLEPDERDGYRYKEEARNNDGDALDITWAKDSRP